MDALVTEALDHLGGAVRPPKGKVCVRTIAPPEMTDGGILITDHARRFYKGSPVHHQVDAVVVAGEGEGFGVGDRVRFSRTRFVRLGELNPKALLGLIPAEDIYGRHTMETP